MPSKVSCSAPGGNKHFSLYIFINRGGVRGVEHYSGICDAGVQFRTLCWQVMCSTHLSPYRATKDTFQKTIKTGSTGIQTQTGIQKVLVSLPFLKETESSKGSVKKKEAGDYHLLSTQDVCLRYIISLSSNCIVIQVSKTRLPHGQTAVNSSANI